MVLFATIEPFPHSTRTAVPAPPAPDSPRPPVRPSVCLPLSPSLSGRKKTRGCYKPLSGQGEAEVERCGRSRDGRGRGEEGLAF